MSMRQDLISIVVPVFEEAGNLSELCDRIGHALRRVRDIEYEIILIDDGSRDGSWQIISDLRMGNRRVKGVKLSRNFGHQYALTAGYHYSTGDATITLDADLQHPPELLPSMIEKWRQGYDVVSMVREESDLESAKSLSSRLFYRFINQLSEIPIKPAVADFRLLDRRVVKMLNRLKERGRFVRGLVSWIGFREAEIRYTPALRFSGQTKYTFRRMIALALDAISSFSTKPLRISFYVGLAVSLICVALAAYAIYNKIYEDKDLSQWASTFLTMLFLDGIQLLMIGLMGVYVGRIFDEVKRRPLYIAEEELGIAPRPRKHFVVGQD
jgi:dolichol-phosphate mannosyltransferase